MSGSALDLDSILDDALDEFDRQDASERATREGSSAPLASALAHGEMDAEKARNVEYMERLLGNLDDPAYGKVLHSTLKSLSATAGGKSTVEDLFAQLGDGFKNDNQLNTFPTDPNDVKGIENADRKIAATLDMLAKAQGGMRGFEASKIEEASETMMEDMMAEFEALGEKDDYNDVCTYACMR